MTLTNAAARVTLIATLSLAPSIVHAGGFMVAHFGGEHGNPMDSNPTSLYYNPAGLAGIGGTKLYLEGDFAFRKLDYTRDLAAIDGTGHDSTYNDAETGKGGLTNILASPFLGVASSFGVDGLGVGAGVFVPFGGEATFDKDDAFKGNATYPGAVDGPQRWQDIEGIIRAIYASAGAGYRFSFGLKIGASVNVVLNQVDDIKAFNADGTDTLLTGAGGVQEGRAWAKTSSVTVAAGIGLQFTPPSLPGLTIGASYQSQPGFGKMTQSGDVEIKLGTAPVIKPKIDLEYALPDVIRAGISYRVSEKLQLRLWGALERWSVFEAQCFTNQDIANAKCAYDDRGQTTADAVVVSNIPRNWKDVFNVRLSGSYWVSPKLELLLGVGYDGDAVPDETMNVDLPDFKDIEVNAGVQYAILDKLQLYVGFSQFIYFSKTVDPEPRTNGNRTTYTPPSRQPGNSGKYSEAISLLTVGLAYTF